MARGDSEHCPLTEINLRYGSSNMHCRWKIYWEVQLRNAGTSFEDAIGVDAGDGRNQWGLQLI